LCIIIRRLRLPKKHGKSWKKQAFLPSSLHFSFSLPTHLATTLLWQGCSLAILGYSS
jgi:hypothetical protein